MNKYTKLFIIINLFFSIFFLKPNKIFALITNDEFTKSFIGKYHYVDYDGKYGDFEHFKRKSDGATAYCIEPRVSLAADSYKGYYSLTLSDMAKYAGLSNDILNKISMISFFGAGYKNHIGDEWIVATQALIWNTLGREYYFTSKNDKEHPFANVIDTPDEIQSKMDEINNLVNDYTSVPPINYTHVSIPIRSSYTFTDSRFKNFHLDYCNNCDYVLNDNSFQIIPKNNSGGNIRINKGEEVWSSPYVVYVNSGGQNLVVPGNIDRIFINLSYSVVSGSLKLHNYDMDNRSCEPRKGGKLEGSIYKLYKSDGTFVKDLVIDSECNYNVDDLDLGSYYIEQDKPGLNYEEDKNKYYFDLDMDNNSKDLTIYSKMYLGGVNLNKFDLFTKSCKSLGSSSLKGALYGIYDSKDNLIKELNIDSNCNAKSDLDLLVGNYYLKELVAPKGYKLDTKIENFSITKEDDGKYVDVTLYDEAYNTNLVIDKTYEYKDKVFNEVGAEFKVYLKSDGSLVDTLHIDASGRATINLVYGDYVIKQTKGIKNYYLSDDIDLVVNSLSNEYTYISLVNKPYTSRLVVKKVDELGNPIKSNKFKFKIYDEINKQYVCQNLYYPNNESVCEYSTNDLGEFITPEVLYPSKYKIIETDTDVGYLINDLGYEFEIGENTSFINDSKLGRIIEINYVNNRVKGRINIEKMGESLSVKDNKYFYNNIKLSNVVFNLIANEDIYENEILIYKKGDIVKVIETDAFGLASVSSLPLGKYILKEVKSNKDNIIDNNIYEIELKYKDKYTKEVSVDINIMNHLRKGQVVIKKIDSLSNIGLKDALIGIYTLDDNLVYSGLTDEYGYIKVNDLFAGHFYLKELSSPDGYDINPNKFYFEINDNNNLVNIVIEDNKIYTSNEIKIPKTKLNISKYEIVIISLIIIVLLNIIYVKIK